MSNKINSIGLKKLNNAEHVNFHNQVLSFIDVATPVAINVGDALRVAYLECVVTEQDIVKRQQGTALTQTLAEVDAERDSLVVFLTEAVANAQRSPIAAQQAAHKALTPVVKPYLGIGRDASGEESAEIIGLLSDLSDEGLTAHITALHLAEVIEALEAANNQFQKLDLQRTADMPTKANTDAVRQTADELYAQVVELANASLLLKPSPAATQFASNVNNHIVHTQNVYNQRMGVEQAKKEKK